MGLCVLLHCAKLTAIGNNTMTIRTFLSPVIVSTSTRMHCEFLGLLFLQAHLEIESHFTESLCAFHSVRFDIPFLRTALKLSEQTTAVWLFKTTDILEDARLGLFGPEHTFGLNLLCQYNQVPVKSWSGIQVIKFAREHKWDELEFAVSTNTG